MENFIEEICSIKNVQLSVLPIRYPKIWEAYKTQLAAIWTAEEIDLSKDYNDFVKLNKDEQYFISNILGFFSASDTLVNINLTENFINSVTIREAIITWQFQIMMENIHSETYSLFIDNLIKDSNEKDKLLNAIHHIPCIKEKMEWVIKWINSDDRIGKKLIANAILEGIFFSGSFCAIFWLKQRNLMPGLTQANSLIARDEGAHMEFACLMYSMIKEKETNETVYKMIDDAIEIESKFITESLPCRLIGMNSNMMINYIKFVADKLIEKLGYNRYYNIDNPFPWMENISLENKSNFFDVRASEYQHAYVNNQNKEFNLEDDF